MTQRLIAFPLSFLFPGLGQAWRGDARRGLALAAVYWLAFTLTWGFLILHLPPGKTTVFILMLSHWGARLAMAVDAYGMPMRRHVDPRLLVSPVLFCALPWLCGELLSDLRWVRARTVTMPSSSMQPGLHEGEALLTDCRPRLYRDGEVVVVRSPHGLSVKRIVASGGETFEQREGALLRNGRPIDMPWASEAPSGCYPLAQVPAGAYYVIGDDLNNSTDSREYGPVLAEQIVGRPLWILSSSSWERVGEPVE